MCSQHEGLLSETRKAIGTVALRVRPEHEPLELEVSLKRRGSREPQTQVLVLLIPTPAWGGGKAAPSPPWQDAGLCPDSGQHAKLWQACSAPAAWCHAISCPLPATVIILRVAHPACMESALPVPVGLTQQGCGPGRGFCLQSSPEPSRRQGEHRILLVLQPCAKEPWVPGGVRAERKWKMSVVEPVPLPPLRGAPAPGRGRGRVGGTLTTSPVRLGEGQHQGQLSSRLCRWAAAGVRDLVLGPRWVCLLGQESRRREEGGGALGPCSAGCLPRRGTGMTAPTSSAAPPAPAPPARSASGVTPRPHGRPSTTAAQVLVPGVPFIPVKLRFWLLFLCESVSYFTQLGKRRTGCGVAGVVESCSLE